MTHMLDLIRESKVPANLMQAAARGSLSVPNAEMMEILVHLALHHKGLGQQARITLAGWDEKASVAAASNPATSREVLGYLVSLEHVRTQLVWALTENPAVTEEELCELAGRGPRGVAVVLLESARVANSPALLRALKGNVNLRANELAEVEAKLTRLGTQGTQVTHDESGAHPEADAGGEKSAGEEAGAAEEARVADGPTEEALTGFLRENAKEVEEEKDKAFQPIGGMHDHEAETTPAAAATAVATTGEAEGKVAPGTAAAAAAAAVRKHAPPGHVERRDSTLQKIAKLDVKGRIALAVRGSKEERSILIRDGTKLVALAVLESPKISDTEVEGFAQQKNVLEAVLRQIPLKRRFAKNYNIMRNLVFNPRTPLDLSLTLMKGLLVHDLRNLAGNKEVSETIRKLALRMFKQKSEKKQHT